MKKFNQVILSKNRIYFIENNVSASMAVENAYPSHDGMIITRNFLTGKITSSQAIQRIKRLYGVRTWKSF